jgi:hypothetical protein
MSYTCYYCKSELNEDFLGTYCPNEFCVSVDGKTQMRVYSDGCKKWFFYRELHREDGPAVEMANGKKYWYKDGELHRLGGPAVEYPDGYKEYWVNGNLCKTILADGTVKYPGLDSI